MSSISAIGTVPTAATAVLPAVPSLDTVVGGGGRKSGNFLSKIFSGKTLLFAGLGAAAGVFLPVIPGGPLGGAAIGAALALLL